MKGRAILFHPTTRICLLMFVGIVLIAIQACKAPNYKQLVGEWEINEFHVVIKDNSNNLLKDTTLKNCGRFVFYKVDDFSKKENKGKIKGFVEKPVYLNVNGVQRFIQGKSWFEGEARKPEIVGNDIEFWFSGLTIYKVSERDGNKLTLYFDGGPSYQENLIVTKK
ncbi:MAG: hypothetical protein IT244_10515 [Bacteroidia bacterium]|nr:hypothetical protein [Bacteroidia bacterium]